MDGYAATREIQRLQAEREKPIPIIALTANASVEDRKACIEAGMDDFIAKPFNNETLIEKIHQYASTSGSIDLQPKSAIAGTEDALDLQVFNGLIEIMGDDFNELLSAYLQSSEELLASLLEPDDQQDFKEMQRNAHSLKSSSANIGAINLSARAKQLENQFRKREPADDSQLQALSEEYQRVRQALLEITTDEPEVKILST
jgi:HPt (histidine-containing phosphotransfer) domain-containing protein